MAERKTIRVMIVDDHPVVRSGLRSMLGTESDLAVAGEAENGQEAIRRFRELTPDVTLMDLRMPGMSGVATIEAIRAEFPNARMIVLSTFDTDEDVYRAVRAGAQGYLLKEAYLHELVDAIRTVHAGGRRIPSAIAERLAERMTSPELSPRELEVLHLVVRGESNKRIAAALNISEATVKGHVNNIFIKLGVSDRTEAAMTALQRGIVQLE